MTRAGTDWKGIVIVALTVAGLVFSAARWAGRIETKLEQLEPRMKQLEERDQYIHGAYTVPEGAK